MRYDVVLGVGCRINFSCYKNDYIRFLVFSHASNDETIYHLEKITVLYPEFVLEFETLKTEYNTLGGKINNYKK